MKRKILFRCDGGAIPELGTGHVIRCLILAKQLKSEPDTEVAFLMHEDPQWTKVIGDEGFEVFSIPHGSNERHRLLEAVTDFEPDIVVVDMLKNDPEYLKFVKNTGAILITLDDVQAGVDKIADVTINPILSNGTAMYEGYDYMVLPEATFIDAPAKVNDGKTRVFVCFGGYDHCQHTLKFVNQIAANPLDNMVFNVVVGRSIQNYAEIEKIAAKQSHINLYQNPENFNEMLSSSDLAVVSGGLTMFQTVACGVPCICVAQYEHQKENAEKLANHRAVVNLGLNVEAETIIQTLTQLATDKTKLTTMSRQGRTLFSGRGNNLVTETVGVIRKLDWDSDFFGKKIAQLRTNRLRDSVLNFSLQNAKRTISIVFTIFAIVTINKASA